MNASKLTNAAMLSFAIAANGVTLLAPTAALAENERQRGSATAVFGSLFSDTDMDAVASYGSGIGCSVSTRKGSLPGGIRLAAPGFLPPKVGVALDVAGAETWLYDNC